MTQDSKVVCSVPAVLSPGTLVGTWRIIGVLSIEGVMGEIYEAEHTLGRDIAALKLLRARFASSESALERSHLEAIVGARVRHPNLNAVLDTGEYQGRPFLVTALLTGKNLRAWLAELGAFPIDEALHVALELGAALDALHSQARVIHRDIKPENIFVSYDGSVKLLDLGVAKLLTPSSSSPRDFATDTGELTGSLAYMAPEQLENEPSFASDLYALGLVLYEMVAGRHPLLDAEGNWPPYGVLIERLQSRATLPALCEASPGCPASVSTLVMQCLAASPEVRPLSARRLRELLQSELDRFHRRHGRRDGHIFRRAAREASPSPRPGAAHTSPSPPPTASPAIPNSAVARRNFALTLALAIAVLLMMSVGALVYWTRTTHHTSSEPARPLVRTTP
jgi:serine/threonine protein kinase